MKSNTILFYIISVISIASSHLIYCQTTVPTGAPRFQCEIQNQGSSLNLSSTCTPVFSSDYNQAPIINVMVNVHIWNSNENLSNATLVSRVKQFIEVCNSTLDDMQQNFQLSPNGQPAPLVDDAKFRLKLYSEASNTADVNGGIWVYPTKMHTWSGSILNYPVNTTNFPGYSNKYSNKVVDILFINFGSYSTSGFFANNARATGYVGGTGGKLVVMADLNGAFQADALNGTTNQNNLIWRSIARATNHEIAHILSLRHTFECNGANGCNDIDVNRECGSNCSSFKTCGFPNNPSTPSSLTCPNTNLAICKYANSHNIMAYDWWQFSITRCQWEKVYGYATSVQSSNLTIKTCPTAQTITLTSSPLPDYRASQQITSTSVLTVGKDLTYQAPLIKLNAGFKIPKGTYFLGYPSTFPCCAVPPSTVGIANTNQTISIFDEEQVQMQVAPNPFSDYLNIQFLFSEKQGRPLRIEIFDINGKSIHAVNTNDGSDLMLDTKEYASGYYSLKVTSENWNKVIPIIKY